MHNPRCTSSNGIVLPFRLHASADASWRHLHPWSALQEDFLASHRHLPPFETFTEFRLLVFFTSYEPNWEKLLSAKKRASCRDQWMAAPWHGESLCMLSGDLFRDLLIQRSDAPALVKKEGPAREANWPLPIDVAAPTLSGIETPSRLGSEGKARMTTTSEHFPATACCFRTPSGLTCQYEVDWFGSCRSLEWFLSQNHYCF